MGYVFQFVEIAPKKSTLLLLLGCKGPIHPMDHVTDNDTYCWHFGSVVLFAALSFCVHLSFSLLVHCQLTPCDWCDDKFWELNGSLIIPPLFLPLLSSTPPPPSHLLLPPISCLSLCLPPPPPPPPPPPSNTVCADGNVCVWDRETDRQRVCVSVCCTLSSSWYCSCPGRGRPADIHTLSLSFRVRPAGQGQHTHSSPLPMMQPSLEPLGWGRPVLTDRWWTDRTDTRDEGSVLMDRWSVDGTEGWWTGGERMGQRADGQVVNRWDRGQYADGQVVSGQDRGPMDRWWTDGTEGSVVMDRWWMEGTDTRDEGSAVWRCLKEVLQAACVGVQPTSVAVSTARLFHS